MKRNFRILFWNFPLIGVRKEVSKVDITRDTDIRLGYYKFSKKKSSLGGFSWFVHRFLPSVSLVRNFAIFNWFGMKNEFAEVLQHNAIWFIQVTNLFIGCLGIFEITVSKQILKHPDVFSQSVLFQTGSNVLTKGNIMLLVTKHVTF